MASRAGDAEAAHLAAQVSESKFQQHIQKQGQLKGVRSVKMLLCGPPETGKTTTMLRLTNNLRCIDPDGLQLPSTVLGKPRTIQLRHMLIGDEKVWNFEESVKKLGQSFYSLILDPSHTTGASPTITGATPTISDDRADSGAKQATTAVQDIDLEEVTRLAEAEDWEKVKKKLTKFEHSGAKQATTAVRDIDLEEVTQLAEAEEWEEVKKKLTEFEHSGAKQATAAVRDINLEEVTRLAEAEEWVEVKKKLTEFEHITILYVIDSGGQPECHEILPLLLDGHILSLIFLNLTKKLGDKYPVLFRTGKSTAYDEKPLSDFTTGEVIQRILTSVSSLQSAHHNSIAVFVGTYFDKATQHQVLDLDRAVQSTFRVFIDENIVCPVGVEGDLIKYIETLDNTSSDQRDIERLRTLILRIINEQFWHDQEYGVPTGWMLLHLILRDKYQERGWCTMAECIATAASCGITENELPYVLKYIHKNYGTILYYPGVLKDIVICDPDVILSPLKSVFEYVLTCEVLTQITVTKHIRNTGEISQDSLEFCFKKDGVSLPTPDVIALFKHCHILCETSYKEFFMPCLLRTDNSIIEEANDPQSLALLNPAPVLFVPMSKFQKNCATPLGVFSALVVEMSADEKWKCNKSKFCFKNRIQFDVMDRTSGRKYTTELRLYSTYIELRHIHGPINTKMLFTFHRELCNALDRISQQFSHTKAIKWEWGFYCPGSLKQGSSPHLALVQRNIPAVEMTCNFEPPCHKRITDLKEKHEIWFERVPIYQDPIDYNAAMKTVGLEVTIHVTNIGTQGYPGTGKTSTLDLITGEKSVSIRNSTGFVESASRRMYIQKVKDSTVWEKVNTVKMSVLVCEAMKEKIKEGQQKDVQQKLFQRDVQQKDTQQKPVQNKDTQSLNNKQSSLEDEDTPLESRSSRPHTEPAAATSMSHKPNNSSSTQVHDNITTQSSSSPQQSNKSFDPLSTFTDLLHQLNEIKASGVIFESRWMVVTDCGGQPPFLDAAALFVRNRCLQLIPVKLNECLNKQPRFSYYVNEKDTSCNNIFVPQTNRQVLQTLAKSVAGIQSTSTQSGTNSQGRSKFIIVGTFSDKESECASCCKAVQKESILRKDLQSTSTQSRCDSQGRSKFVTDGTFSDKETECASCCETVQKKEEILQKDLEPYKLINVYDDGKLIVPINAATDDENERDKFATKLQDLIKSSGTAIEYKVKLSYFILFLSMNNMSKEINKAILHINDCIKLGESLNMKETETRDAIRFFHNIGCIMHFEDTCSSSDPKLRIHEYVVVDDEPVLKRVSRLLSVSFVCREYFNEDCQDEHCKDLLESYSASEQICPFDDTQKNLRHYGEFDPEELKEFLKLTKKELNFFLAMLQHVKAIAKISSGKYFMPCALQYAKEKYVQDEILNGIFDYVWAIKFREMDGKKLHIPVPVGYLPALVVILVTDFPSCFSTVYDMRMHQYRNCVTLQYKEKIRWYVYIVECHLQLEVYFSRCLTKGCTIDCSVIREVVLEAMIKTNERLRISIDNINCFLCSCGKDSSRHFCTYDTGSNVVCEQYPNEPLELNDKQRIWISPDNDMIKANSYPVCSELLTEPFCTSCEHHVCKRCCDELTTDKADCPVCHKANVFRYACFDPSFQREVNSLRVRCQKGCKWVGEVKDLQKHLDEHTQQTTHSDQTSSVNPAAIRHKRSASQIDGSASKQLAVMSYNSQVQVKTKLLDSPTNNDLSNIPYQSSTSKSAASSRKRPPSHTVTSSSKRPAVVSDEPMRVPNYQVEHKGATPTLLDLMTMIGANGEPLDIVQKISAVKYMTFGMCLLQDKNGHAVDLIKKNHNQDGAESVIQEIIKTWLNSDAPTRTYDHMIACLRLSKLGALADDITTAIVGKGDKMMKVPQSLHAAGSATNSGIAYSSQTEVESPVSQEDGDSDHH